MRLLELDFLRFIAVMLVLGRHMHPCPSEVSTSAAGLSQVWQRGGWIGVDMFFVLSGFLVSGLLFREYEKHSSLDVTRFLIRRAFKIYPAFWAMIAATVVLSSVRFVPLHGSNVWSELLFIQNYVPGLWNHTWSLAVEEHFYLLLAATVALLVGRQQAGQEDPLSAIPFLFYLTAVICLLLRVVTVNFLPYQHVTHVFATHLRIDSLMFGVLLAYYWQRNEFIRSDWIRERAPLLVMTGMMLLSPAFFFPLETTRWIVVFGFISFYVGSGAILIGLLHVGLPKIWSVQSVSLLGAYSYSIYLWHMPVHDWLVPSFLAAMPQAVGGNWFIYVTLYIVGSYFVGIFMCRLIESPVLSLRDRWFPSRSRALALEDSKARPAAIPNDAGLSPAR